MKNRRMEIEQMKVFVELRSIEKVDTELNTADIFTQSLWHPVD